MIMPSFLKYQIYYNMARLVKIVKYHVVWLQKRNYIYK